MMSKLNVFIDGTWLFYQCGAGQSLAHTTEFPDNRFSLDFTKLNQMLLQHAQAHGGNCDNMGDCYIATSIFQLPDNFDDWPNQYNDLSTEQIERVRRGVFARDEFSRAALRAGYKDDAIFRPAIKDYIIRRLTARAYQEKQVDTSVVALLVRFAITRPGDYHIVITGDSDILPAIRVAYPEYTHNVIMATTHPDELKAAHRQTSFSFLDFAFAIPPFYLQDNTREIIEGEYVYKCAECGKVFTRNNPIPQKARPYCNIHRPAVAAVPNVSAS
jgi:hypothetical protein